jgi:hypothetical protein
MPSVSYSVTVVPASAVPTTFGVALLVMPSLSDAPVSDNGSRAAVG